MRFLIILTLIMLPMTVAQFYSTDSYAVSRQSVDKETLFNTAELPKKDDSTKITFIDEKQLSDEIVKTPKRKPKKIRMFKGKQNAQGMQLLSVLLMLKEKQR